MTENLKAYAKINITLDVVGKRPDGYHNLKSIMQTVSLYDEIDMKTDDSGEIIISVNWPYLVTDKRNIAYKAADLFFKKTGIRSGLSIGIHKKIPMGAGLGGGSADAAAVLTGLNKMFGNPLTYDALAEVGLMCGADVPFCLKKGTCLAEGLGEILTPLPSFPDCFILIAKPLISLSTKSVFEDLSIKNIKHHPNTDGVIEALHEKNLFGISIRVYNVLEETVRERYRDLDFYKGIMLENGALGAAMTGSGSVVFGIFDEKKLAQNAADKFNKLTVSTFITKPLCC